MYRFFNLKPFEHDFENIPPFKVNNVEYQDKVYGDNMHTIKPKIVDDDMDLQKYRSTIPKKIYEKYHEVNKWLMEIR